MIKNKFETFEQIKNTVLECYPDAQILEILYNFDHHSSIRVKLQDFHMNFQKIGQPYEREIIGGDGEMTIEFDGWQNFDANGAILLFKYPQGTAQFILYALKNRAIASIRILDKKGGALV